MANRRIKLLKRKKVRKLHLLSCLQQRYLLASIGQKTKIERCVFTVFFFFSLLSFEFLSFLRPKKKNRAVMIKIFVSEFLANRRKKSLKRKKVRKSHVLFCLQQRCLLASIDQKTKIKRCVFNVFFFSFLSFF